AQPRDRHQGHGVVSKYGTDCSRTHRPPTPGTATDCPQSHSGQTDQSRDKGHPSGRRATFGPKRGLALYAARRVYSRLPLSSQAPGRLRMVEGIVIGSRPEGNGGKRSLAAVPYLEWIWSIV